MPHGDAQLFDLKSALSVCTPSPVRPLLRAGKDIGEIADRMYRETDGFDPDKTVRLFIERMKTVQRHEDAWVAEAVAQQKHGALGPSIGSWTIIEGFAGGMMAREIPTRWLSLTDWLPRFQGDDRYILSLLLFFRGLVKFSIEGVTVTVSAGTPDYDLWEWHLLRAVGRACGREILDRLSRHPLSKAVYDVLIHDDKRALGWLVNRTWARAYDVPDDLKERGGLSTDVFFAVVDKIRAMNPLADVNDPDVRALYALSLAMDGAFADLPTEVQRNLLDELRAQSAKKRGGDGEQRPTFDNLTFDGAPAGLRKDPSSSGDGERGPHAGRPDRRFSDMSRERTTEHVQRIELIGSNLEVQLGPKATLLRLRVEYPESGNWTQAEVAERLGVTARTIRNYEDRLRQPGAIKHIKKFL